MATHVTVQDLSVNDSGAVTVSTVHSVATLTLLDLDAVPVGVYTSSPVDVSAYSRMSIAIVDQQTDVSKRYILQLRDLTAGFTLHEIELRPIPSVTNANDRTLFYGNISLYGVDSVRVILDSFAQEGAVSCIIYAST